jgi:hypothetical protein
MFHLAEGHGSVLILRLAHSAVCCDGGIIFGISKHRLNVSSVWASRDENFSAVYRLGDVDPEGVDYPYHEDTTILLGFTDLSHATLARLMPSDL